MPPFLRAMHAAAASLRGHHDMPSTPHTAAELCARVQAHACKRKRVDVPATAHKKSARRLAAPCTRLPPLTRANAVADSCSSSIGGCTGAVMWRCWAPRTVCRLTLASQQTGAWVRAGPIPATAAGRGGRSGRRRRAVPGVCMEEQNGGLGRMGMLSTVRVDGISC